MSGWRLWLAVCVLGLLLGLGLARLTQRDQPGGVPQTQPQSELAVGQRQPGFSLSDLDGKQVGAEQFAGRAMLVNFWATWCAPCRREMPALQAASDRDGVALAVGTGLVGEARRSGIGAAGVGVGPLVGADLLVESGGDITDSGDLSVSGLASFSANAGSADVTLGDAGDTVNFGREILVVLGSPGGCGNKHPCLRVEGVERHDRHATGDLRRATAPGCTVAQRQHHRAAGHSMPGEPAPRRVGDPVGPIAGPFAVILFQFVQLNPPMTVQACPSMRYSPAAGKLLRRA